MPEQQRGGELDGLRLALINNRMEGVVRAMMNTLLRTSRSAILNTARDFSCCIVSAGDELLAMAESLPIHVMSGPDLMARVMKDSGPELRRGDAFLNNSPYHGNSHAADWTVLVPVVDDEGAHRYTVLAKAHLADCGNAVPTTYVADARDVYEEGALIYPCVKVQEDYRDREDILRLAEIRIRVPELWHGDFLALLGAARIGERHLLGMIGELGDRTLRAYEAQWFDYSEQRMRAAIGAMPGGSIVREANHDPIPSLPEGVRVTVGVSVDPDAERIEVDLTDNPDCLPCGLNLTEATSKTAAMMGVFTAIGARGEVVPPNAGSFRRLTVHQRENCIVGIPRHPFSCSAGTTNLSEIVGNCVAAAIAELGEGVGMAETGRAQPPSTAVISGHDPRPNGGPFVNQLMLAATAGSAGPQADGWLTTLGLGAAGFLLRDSVEIDEMKYPIRVHEQRLAPDTEGAGRHRGAPGARVEIAPVGTTLEAIYLSDGTYNAARGVRGGHDAEVAQGRRRAPDGTESDELGTYVHLTLEPGERLVSVCAGGGGYGPPTERDPTRVAKDVREGWISRERARDVYGVVFDPDSGGPDLEATVTLRARIEDG